MELPEVIEEQHGDSSNEESIAEDPLGVPGNNPMALSDPLVNIQNLEINPLDMQDSSNIESIAEDPLAEPVSNPMALSDPLVNIQDLEINPQDMQQPEIVSPEKITKEVRSKEPSPYFARQKTEKPASPPKDKPANLPDPEQDQPSTTEEFILPKNFEELPQASILEPVVRAQTEPDASSDGGNE